MDQPISRWPFSSILCSLDPFDPLSAEAASEPAENIELEGAPESEAVDESTNGFLDKVTDALNNYVATLAG